MALITTNSSPTFAQVVKGAASPKLATALPVSLQVASLTHQPTSVPPTAPAPAASDPAPRAPSPEPAFAPIVAISSSARSTRGETKRTHSRMARESTEELIGSLVDGDSPSASFKGRVDTTAASPSKGKAKAVDNAPTPSASGSTAVTLYSAGLSLALPADKETAVAGVKRLHKNMESVAHAHEVLVRRVDIDNADLSERVQRVQDIMSALMEDLDGTNARRSDSTSLPDPTLSALVVSHNEVVNAVQVMQTDATAARDSMHSIAATLASVQSSINNLSEPTVVPATKRGRFSNTYAADGLSTLVTSDAVPTAPQAISLTATTPAVLHMQSAHPLLHPPPPAAPMVGYMVPPPPAAAPLAMPAPSPTPSNADVEVGPVHWGRDITGEFRGLLNLVRLSAPINHAGLRARRYKGRPTSIIVRFASSVDAIVFVNSYYALPPPAFPNLSPALMAGN